MPHIDVPVGSIIIWAGAIVDIPAGFILCDGNGGTPDLRNRFIPGAGDTFGVGASGGADTHNHTGTTDGHNHAWQVGTDMQAGANIQLNTTPSVDTFTTDPASNIPLYYALAYIMKT